jgi:hypothetical protein
MRERGDIFAAFIKLLFLAFSAQKAQNHTDIFSADPNRRAK